MKSLRHIFGIGVLVITFLFSNQIFSQKRNNGANGNTRNERNLDNNRVQSTHRANDRYRTQPVRRSPHYRYPRHRHVLRYLPVHHTTIVFRGLPYYYHSGIYYTTYGNEYIVVVPPRGFRIAVLPAGHVRIVIGPSVYFYYSGVYYIDSSVNSLVVENEDRYEVTSPPIGAELDKIPEEAGEVVIDGIRYYEQNDVLYKKSENTDGKTVYKVVYSS
ncbi:hypothetical protein A9Q87_02650 [Flavobacteriales bacterium 34_180_T64]|nr:hypothetical protein A9Q87_02650 [Flavobacteriales bacterium 34_180_T64]